MGGGKGVGNVNRITGKKVGKKKGQQIAEAMAKRFAGGATGTPNVVPGTGGTKRKTTILRNKVGKIVNRF